MSSLPLAIFAYNRPESLKRLLGSLRDCDGFNEAQVTIFIDGPRSPADQDAVAATRQVAESLVQPHWVIKADTVNKGLRRSISQGVTDVCDRFGRAIVLEDDLVLSPVALRYFQAGLDRYENDPRVWSVCGYMYESPGLARRNANFFLPMGHPWGWATWQRAWTQFDAMTNPIAPVGSPTFRKHFDVFGLRDFSNMLAMAIDGKIDSWFIRWHYRIFQSGGVSLFPPVSHVHNGGLTNGTHGSKLNPYEMLGPKPSPLPKAVAGMPEVASVDYAAIDTITASWDARLQKGISAAGRMKRRMRAAKRAS